MKRILIAIDSFKGCMTSAEANTAARRAVEDYAYEANGQEAGTDVSAFTVSDGGEGMLDAFSSAIGCRKISVPVHDALMRPHAGEIAIKDNTAVIEVAQAAGLTLIEPQQRNPLVATSYGVGELIAEALRHCCTHLIIGLGGTATSDCGIGMLHALIDNLTHDGNIDDLHLDNVRVTLATDVDNPLLGPDGAASVFAPQKGATPAMVKLIEHRAATFARLSALHCHKDESQTGGAGAAGGLGYAFLQFFNSTIESGADLLFRLLHLDDVLAESQLVITGEGRSDAQTLMGKLPMRILEHAKRRMPEPEVWLLAGKIDDAESLSRAGFSRVASINSFLRTGENPMDKAIAMRNLEATIKSLLENQKK